MSIGSSLGISLPVPGSNTNTWGADLNRELQKIIDAVEGQVPASAIDFSADFDLNGYALTSVDHSAYDALSAAPSDLRSVYFNSSGDLYIVNGSGVAVQITSGSGLSAAGGSITGGSYGSSGVELNFDGTNYDFKDGSGANDFAPIEVGSLRLNDASSNALIHTVGSMSSNVTLTWPSAVAAGAGYLLQSDGSGNLSWSNTALAAATFASTVSIAGKLTLSGGLAHGTRTIQIPVVAGIAEGTQGTDYSWGNGTHTSVGAGSKDVQIPIQLLAGDQITSILIYGNYASTATKNFYFYKTTVSGGITLIDSTTSTSSGDTSTTFNVTDSTIAGDEMYYLKYTSGAAGDILYGIIVTYDRP